jgi:polysaccharide export outer membrane protein
LLSICLLVPLLVSGCLGSAPKAPEGTQEEIFEQYADQYERSEAELTQAGAVGTGAGGTSQQERLELGTSGEALRKLQESASQNPTFTMIDGLPRYRFGVGDLIEVTSYIETAPTVAILPVQEDGNIYYHRFGIGYVPAAGRAAVEIAEDLVGRLREYVPGAHVEIEVSEYRAWGASLTGEVMITPRANSGPGNFPLRGRTTVSQFIYDHGGPTAEADLADVRLDRDGRQYRLDIRGARGGGSSDQDIVLLPGDIVMIPSAAEGGSRYYVLGEVNRPGTYPLTEGATVMDAIALAGSFTEWADAPSTFIGRYGSEEQQMSVNVSAIVAGQQPGSRFQLQPGDYVIVPRRTPTFWERTREWVILSTLIVNIIIILNLR